VRAQRVEPQAPQVDAIQLDRACIRDPETQQQIRNGAQLIIIRVP
jgi:hypothetical protein